MSTYRSGGGTRIAPTSFSQQALWLLGEVLPQESVYNESDVFRLQGALNIEALEAAINEIVRRHEVLRTHFAVENGEPVQVIVPELKVPLDVTDLTALRDSEREAEAQRLARDEAQLRFDLEHGPLIRVQLLRLRKDEHWLIQTMHHIVRDGGSMVVFAQELSGLYGAYSSGKPSPLPELPVQYADYAVWQRAQLQGEVLKEQLAYWKQTLADLPVLELPTDRPRAAASSYRGGRIAFELGEELTRGLKKLRRREETTLFTTLLAAFQVLLYRYSGQEDIAVGVPIAGRMRPEVKGSIGFFVNLLVLRADLSGEPSFSEYLARVRRQTREAYAHQDVPFAKLVEELAPKRDPSRNPLFQVSFVKGTEPDERPELRGLTVDTVETAGTETVKFDLSVSVADEGREIRVVIDYATDLFDASTIERLAGHWQVLLEGIVADPTQPISRLPLLTAAERERLLGPCKAAAATFARHDCIHQWFEAQVRRRPETTAVVFEEQRLSYSELNARANRLAHHLRTLGVGPEVLVALAMERSPDAVVGLLGILKAGGAYVPLDPRYPAERLAFMLADTRAPVLLTQERLLGQLPAYAGRTLCLDRDWPTIAAQSDSNPAPTAKGANLAYVIYTSGSTGQPKGTLVTHHNVVRLFAGSAHWFDFDARDVWTCFHSLAFGFAVWEMWGALIHGGKLVLVPYLVSRDPKEFHALLVRERVTVLSQTPSAFRQLMAVDAGEHASKDLALRVVLLGGERLDFQSLRPWFDRHGDAKPRLVNIYGLTEITVYVTYRPIAIADLNVATGSMIGKPIPDASIVLLDRHLQLVPIGVPGEIFVGGAGVARGYLNRPELTAERFIANPYSTDPMSRLYRSGDLARRTADNDLAYLGRIDLQVKIRGYRIELAEIESALLQHPGVQQAVVVAGEDPHDRHAIRLIAYVVPAAAQSSSPAARHTALGDRLATDLRAHLTERLPDFMVPSVFVGLDQIPLTTNGKADRKRLLAAPRDGFAADSALYVTPCDGIEEQLAAIFGEVLGLDRVGVHSDFFELGGDSLLAVQTLSRVKASFATSISIRSFFSAPTVAQLARQVAAQRESAGVSNRVPRPTPEIRRNPRIPSSRASGTESG